MTAAVTETQPVRTSPVTRQRVPTEYTDRENTSTVETNSHVWEINNSVAHDNVKCMVAACFGILTCILREAVERTDTFLILSSSFSSSE